MRTAIVVTKSEVRKIIAEYFNVPIEDVWPSKYSFTVIQEDGKELPSWSETQKWYKKLVQNLHPRLY